MFWHGWKCIKLKIMKVNEVQFWDSKVSCTAETRAFLIRAREGYRVTHSWFHSLNFFMTSTSFYNLLSEFQFKWTKKTFKFQDVLQADMLRLLWLKMICDRNILSALYFSQKNCFKLAKETSLWKIEIPWSVHLIQYL